MLWCCYVQYFGELVVQAVTLCAQDFSFVAQLCLRCPSKGCAGASQCSDTVAHGLILRAATFVLCSSEALLHLSDDICQ
jgi:hypothetical protein